MNEQDYAEHLELAVRATGVKAIKDARDCMHKVQALYATFENTAAFERLTRAKLRLSKSHGGFSTRYPKIEALDLVCGEVDRQHGFPNYVDHEWLNQQIHQTALRALEISIGKLFPDDAKDWSLAYSDMLETIKLAQHYLLTMNFDLTARLSANKWAKEPL